MKPQFPLISIYNKAMDLDPDSSSLKKATVLCVCYGKNISVAYDCDGVKWHYQLISE